MKKLFVILNTLAVTLALFAALIGVLPAHAAGSIVVDTAADDAIAGDTYCTLREAINNANSDSDTTGGDCAAGSGVDTISFAGDYTITLGSQLPDITTTITITGTGAANTILQAAASPNTASYRV